MKKTLIIFLDFDGVLNNFNSRKRYENINFNPDNVMNFIELINKLDDLNISHTIVLNTAWKLGSGEYLPQELLKKCLTQEEQSKELVDLLCRLNGSMVTPTYHYSNYSEFNRLNQYNCKSFEVESFIVQNLKNDDSHFYLYLDDEPVDFKYLNILQYNTNPELGLTKDDIEEIIKLIGGSN